MVRRQVWQSWSPLLVSLFLLNTFTLRLNGIRFTIEWEFEKKEENKKIAKSIFTSRFPFSLFRWNLRVSRVILVLSSRPSRAGLKHNTQGGNDGKNIDPSLQKRVDVFWTSKRQFMAQISKRPRVRKSGLRQPELRVRSFGTIPFIPIPE